MLTDASDCLIVHHMSNTKSTAAKIRECISISRYWASGQGQAEAITPLAKTQKAADDNALYFAKAAVSHVEHAEPKDGITAQLAGRARKQLAAVSK